MLAISPALRIYARPGYIASVMRAVWRDGPLVAGYPQGMSTPAIVSHPTSLDDLRRFAPAIRDIVARHSGTEGVRVFGSVARGDAGPHSDIDLLVEFRPGATLLDLATIELELAELLDCPVDVMSAHSIGRAADHARAQAVPLP